MSKKLLLADDSVTIQKVVNLTFADEGIEVLTASDGNTALQMLFTHKPDIVIADVNMPGPNGYQICERIKTDERFKNIPVILLVGSFEPFDEEEAKRVGADDFLTKPFQSIRHLMNKVSSLLELRASTAEETSVREFDYRSLETEEYPVTEIEDVTIREEPLSSYTREMTYEEKTEKDLAKTQPLSPAEIKEVGIELEASQEEVGSISASEERKNYEEFHVEVVSQEEQYVESKLGAEEETSIGLRESEVLQQRVEERAFDKGVEEIGGRKEERVDVEIDQEALTGEAIGETTEFRVEGSARSVLGVSIESTSREIFEKATSQAVTEDTAGLEAGQPDEFVALEGIIQDQGEQSLQNLGEREGARESFAGVSAAETVEEEVAEAKIPKPEAISLLEAGEDEVLELPAIDLPYEPVELELVTQQSAYQQKQQAPEESYSERDTQMEESSFEETTSLREFQPGSSTLVQDADFQETVPAQEVGEITSAEESYSKVPVSAEGSPSEESVSVQTEAAISVGESPSDEFVSVKKSHPEESALAQEVPFEKETTLTEGVSSEEVTPVQELHSEEAVKPEEATKLEEVIEMKEDKTDETVSVEEPTSDKGVSESVLTEGSSTRRTLSIQESRSEGTISVQESTVLTREYTINLPPEIIEAIAQKIARKVIEALSEKAIREIAWEVVPQQAELIIRKMVEERFKK